MAEYSMQDALKEFLKKSRIKGSMQAMQIEDVWEQLMGKTIARYTEKIQIFGNKLIITTHVGPLKQELTYQKEKIKQRVNEALNENLIHEVVVQ
jgi:predicted nucleic acid-binding Zn ribbon protein